MSIVDYLSDLPLRVARLLGVEPEWTLQNHDGVGFVVGELGTWLSVAGSSHEQGLLTIEVRVATEVPDSSGTWSFCDDRNHRGLIGRWVDDPASGVVALVAQLRLGAEPVVWTAQAAAEIVAEMVNTAETVIYRSGPQRFLGASKALTVIRGARRTANDEADRHPAMEHLPNLVYPAGATPDVARAVLPLVQDHLVPTLPGWTLEHEAEQSWAEAQDGSRLLVKVARHPYAGWGVMISLGGEAYAAAHEDALPYLVALNRAETHRTGTHGIGSWTYNGAGVEYRAFLPNRLLSCVDDVMKAAEMVLEFVSAAAVRADGLLLDRDPPPYRAPAVLRARWPEDEWARVLARRDQINDGLDYEGPDLSIYVDFLGRACGITDASFQLWLSRLSDEDKDDPSVRGFVQFCRDRIADRARRQRQGQASGGPPANNADQEQADDET